MIARATKFTFKILAVTALATMAAMATIYFVIAGIISVFG